jgi:hypothetical protein
MSTIILDNVLKSEADDQIEKLMCSVISLQEKVSVLYYPLIFSIVLNVIFAVCLFYFLYQKKFSDVEIHVKQTEQSELDQDDRQVDPLKHH